MFAAARALHPARRLLSRGMGSVATTPPVVLLVSVEIEPIRIPAFLKAMTVDAEGSRKEDGCHTFDLLKDESDPHTFYFYEGRVSTLSLRLKSSFVSAITQQTPSFFSSSHSIQRC
jgi:hypothetical protein